MTNVGDFRGNRRLQLRVDSSPHQVLADLAEFLESELSASKSSSRNEVSLWHWDQLVEQLGMYVYESSEMLSSWTADDESFVTDEPLDWAGDPDEIGIFSNLDDFLHHTKYILGRVFDREGRPFRGNVSEALNLHAEKLVGNTKSLVEAFATQLKETSDSSLVDPDEIEEASNRFMELRVVMPNGRLIDKALDEAGWLEARKTGITASDANRLIKLNGERRSTFWDILQSKTEDYVSPHFEAFDLGVEREPAIAEWVISNFPEEGFIVNNWLFESESFDGHLATPDLIGARNIAEIKVSTKPLSQLISRYRDQLQWQMHVLGCDSVLFVVEQRIGQVIQFDWIERDNERISLLIEAANYLLDRFDE
jgi:hypothetical protein